MFWQLEYTDTFGGEANYSWVKRETIPHEDDLTNAQLSKRFKKALGLTGMRGRTQWYGDHWEFRPYNSCTVAFATFNDSDEPACKAQAIQPRGIEMEPSKDFTTEEFLAWAKRKPARQTYTYRDNFHCPIAQFLKSRGFVAGMYNGGFIVSGHGEYYFLGVDDETHYAPEKVWRAAIEMPHNFGALCQRLERGSNDDI